MKRTTFFLSLILLSFSSLHCQPPLHSVVSSSGGQGSNGLLSLEWTVGETVINTFDNQEHILTQGFHQTEITVTSIEKLAGTDIAINVFPNPASQYINISIESQPENYSFALYDFNGREVAAGPLEDTQTLISLAGLTPSVYILRVKQSGKIIETFKVVKH